MSAAISRDAIYRGRRFQSEIIELCVRWYLTYRLKGMEEQIGTPYSDLTEVQKESDRAQVRKYLSLIVQALLLAIEVAQARPRRLNLHARMRSQCTARQASRSHARGRV